MPVIANTQRVLSRAVSAAAAARGARVETIGEGWIHRITLADRVRYVWGYAFDLNPAATHLLVGDKAATSDVLASAGLARVPHQLFLHPDMAGYMANFMGNWAGMNEFAQRHGWDVVIKDNAGTGGRGVYRARTPSQLELAAQTLFQRVNAVALSPFVQAGEECRVILLDGEPLLALRKVRPSIVGDGVRTVLELLTARIAEATRAGAAGGGADALEGLDPLDSKTLCQVPPAGVALLLNWRHNLGQGASAQFIEVHDPAMAPSLKLARDAARACNLRFGSVDMLLTDTGPAVLEINGGVMVEYLSRIHPRGETIAFDIYRRAFDRMFDTTGSD